MRVSSGSNAPAALSVTLTLERWLDFLFHLHPSVRSCRSRRSTGSLPGPPLLAYRQRYRASQNTSVPPSLQTAHTEEAGAKGSRHPSDWSMHTQSGLLCRLHIPTPTLQVTESLVIAGHTKHAQATKHFHAFNTRGHVSIRCSDVL